MTEAGNAEGLSRRLLRGALPPMAPICRGAMTIRAPLPPRAASETVPENVRVRQSGRGNRSPERSEIRDPVWRRGSGTLSVSESFQALSAQDWFFPSGEKPFVCAEGIQMEKGSGGRGRFSGRRDAVAHKGRDLEGTDASALERFRLLPLCHSSPVKRLKIRGRKSCGMGWSRIPEIRIRPDGGETAALPSSDLPGHRMALPDIRLEVSGIRENRNDGKTRRISLSVLCGCPQGA